MSEEGDGGLRMAGDGGSQDDNKRRRWSQNGRRRRWRISGWQEKEVVGLKMVEGDVGNQVGRRRKWWLSKTKVRS